MVNSDEWIGRFQLKLDVTRWRTGGECRGNWRMELVPFTPPRNMMYPAFLPLMRTPGLPVVYWTDAPADVNGLVRFAERRNLVSARVPSHFKRSLLFAFPLQQWLHEGNSLLRYRKAYIACRVVSDDTYSDRCILVLWFGFIIIIMFDLSVTFSLRLHVRCCGVEDRRPTLKGPHTPNVKLCSLTV